MDLASKNPAGGPNCDARQHAIATMLLVHGDQDPIAPIKQSEIMESALKQAGVTVRFIRVPGGKHGPNFQLPAGDPRLPDRFTSPCHGRRSSCSWDES